MKTGQGFLLVFSITSNSSLGELAQLRDEIIRIKDDEHVPIVIVGNKADLEDQRAVPRARAFSISQQWGAPYYEASARTRSKFEIAREKAKRYSRRAKRPLGNVNEVFIDLCRQMLRKDDLSEEMQDDGNDKFDMYKIGRRRRRKRKDGGTRCVIL